MSRPTLTQIIDRVKADIVPALELGGAVLRVGAAQALGRAFAGASHEMHGRISALEANAVPDRLCSDEAFLRHAATRRQRPKPPEFAELTATVSGTNGTVVPDGTSFYRADNVEFQTAGDVTISGGTATLTVVAAIGGIAGNCDNGTALSIGSPMAGVGSVATVASTVTSGTEQESLPEFRVRFAQYMAANKRGGHVDDYEIWALAVPGVTRVWVRQHADGLGTVVVLFVRDGDASIIPSSGEIAEVVAAFADKEPATADVRVRAPVAQNVPLTIQAPTAKREAVKQQIKSLFAHEAEPGDGNGKGTILASALRSAIGAGVGSRESWNLVSPTIDQIPGTERILTTDVESITWA